MAAAAILKNWEITISRPQFKRFRRNLAHWCTSTFFTLIRSRMSKCISVPNFVEIALISAEIWWFFNFSLTIWKFENPTWRRPPSWKFEKSRYLGRGSSDFNKIWRGYAVRPSWPFRTLKISNFENPKNRKITISRPQFKRFRRNLSHWCTSTFLTFSIVNNFENPTWRRPPSWKFEKSLYLGRGWSDFAKIWHSDAVPPAWPFWPLKNWNFENPSWNLVCKLICIGALT